MAGRKPAEDTIGMSVEKAVEVFMQAKNNDGLEPPTLAKLQKTCDRIQEFCEKGGIFTLENVTLIHLTTWPWDRYFGTTHSLRTNQERVKSFFRYFHNAGVIAKNPAAAWKRIKGEVEQVSGFTPVEDIHTLYKQHVPTVMKHSTASGRTKALDKLVSEVFKDADFTHAKTGVGIVATHWNLEKPMIFKSTVNQAHGRKDTFIPGFGCKIGEAVRARLFRLSKVKSARNTAATPSWLFRNRPTPSQFAPPCGMCQ